MTISRWIRALHLPESLPFCGVALLGGMMPPAGDGSVSCTLVGTAAAAWCLAAFAYTFNDLQDLSADRRSGHKTSRPLVAGVLSVGAAWMLNAGLGATGALILLLVAPWPAMWAGLATLPLSIAYSWRRLPLKQIPVASSAVHLVQATLVFAMGAWSTAPAAAISLVTGLYFGLVFAAGHLHHEVLDVQSDRTSRTRTHAVRYGTGPTLAAGLGLWLLSGVHFSLLAWLGPLPVVLGWVQLAMLASYLVSFFFLLRRGHAPGAMKRLQVVYRAVYLAGGFVMLVLLGLGR